MRRRRGARAAAVLLALALGAGPLLLPAAAAVPAGATVWGYSEGLAQC